MISKLQNYKIKLKYLFVKKRSENETMEIISHKVFLKNNGLQQPTKNS